MDVGYLAAPAVGWVVCGSVKFAINSANAGRLAWDRIGYGGMPSTHTAIATTTLFLIGLREGISHPAFGAALSLAVIVAIDGMSLRRKIGEHAEALNRLQAGLGQKPLRESMGHRPAEIVAGTLVGAACAAGLAALSR
ncbi:MAG: divergent PAP2 family protein [Fimbriiglobus sp.]